MTNKRLAAEPRHTALVASRIIATLADELERGGVTTLSVEHLRLLADGLKR